jgi:hypothetical protein
MKKIVSGNWMLRMIVAAVCLHCSMFNVQCSMFNGQWSTFNGQWSTFNGQCSTFNGQCSMFNGQWSTCSAQTVGEVFKAMPDSLTPYLSTNNRLDMLDFMEAKMKAAVTNQLDGESEMLFLSDDSLSIKMSDALLVELRAEREAADTLVDMRQTYQLTNGGKEVVVTRYRFPSWAVVSKTVDTSALFRRDYLLESPLEK